MTFMLHLCCARTLMDLCLSSVAARLKKSKTFLLLYVIFFVRSVFLVLLSRPTRKLFSADALSESIKRTADCAAVSFGRGSDSLTAFLVSLLDANPQHCA